MDAEKRLLTLARTLDAPVSATDYTLALVTLGQRTRTLFRGFLELQGGSARVASRLLLRPIVEINILLRFLARDPDLHTELWQAEAERNTITTIQELHADEHLAERWSLAPLPPEALDDRKLIVAEARAKGREAKVPGVTKNGTVMPGTYQQRKLLKEHAADEAYIMAYRILSWDMHVSPRTFQIGSYEPRNDGSVSYSEEIPPADSVAERALAVAMMASMLKLVGTGLGLPIVEEADDIQRTFVPHQGDTT
jgi:hypothetical protein